MFKPTYAIDYATDKINVTVVGVEVVQPKDDAKVALTDTGVIAAIGYIYPESIRNNFYPIYWKTIIENNVFSKSSSTPLVNITVDLFPDNNSSWGPNFLEATIKVEANESKDIVNIQYFYPLMRTQKSPINWYYYWKQTGASSGIHEYDPNYTKADGYYLGGEDHFHIAPSAAGVDGGLVQKGYGIDNFGSTCLHEKGHMDYWLGTWGDANNSPIDQDKDRDSLKDADEPNMVSLDGQPYDPTKADTNGDGEDDFEDYACTKEKLWVNGTYNEVDWAYPGHQYP